MQCKSHVSPMQTIQIPFYTLADIWYLYVQILFHLNMVVLCVRVIHTNTQSGTLRIVRPFEYLFLFFNYLYFFMGKVKRKLYDFEGSPQ